MEALVRVKGQANTTRLEGDGRNMRRVRSRRDMKREEKQGSSEGVTKQRNKTR